MYIIHGKSMRVQKGRREFYRANCNSFHTNFIEECKFITTLLSYGYGLQKQKSSGSKALTKPCHKHRVQLHQVSLDLKPVFVS